jgi:hypothetical protein
VPRAIDLTGLLKVRGCCVFTWREWREASHSPGVRMVEVGPEHCKGCLDELEALEPPFRLVDRLALEAAAKELVANPGSLPPPQDDLSARRGRK